MAIGRCSPVTRPPSQRITARSIALRSSLMLPGHGWLRSLSHASLESPAAGTGLLPGRSRPGTPRRAPECPPGARGAAAARSQRPRADSRDPRAGFRAPWPPGIAVGRDDHSHVGPLGVRAAEALELTLLQEPEELRLDRRGPPR